MRILSRFIIIFVAVVVALVVIFGVESALAWYLNRSGYFKAMIPNITEVYNTNEFSVRSNISAQGIRNKIVKMPKPKDTLRILALGDSFTYGWGVREQEAWPQVVERLLKEQGRKVEIINAGAPGISLTGIRKICKAYKDQFSVDMILVGIYSLDDLYFVAAREQTQTELEKTLETFLPTLARITQPVIVTSWYEGAKPGMVLDASHYWSEEARAYRLVNPQDFAKMNPRFKSDFLQGKINPGVISFATLDPEYLVKMLSEKNFAYALQATDDRFRLLKERCAGNLPLTIVVLPSNSMVSEEIFPMREMMGFRVDKRLLTLDVDTPLSRIAKKHGFSYVSLIPDFRRDGCPDCYYPIDWHMTKQGHLRVAREVTNHITK